jgi:hypothetical protein
MKNTIIITIVSIFIIAIPVTAMVLKNKEIKEANLKIDETQLKLDEMQIREVVKNDFMNVCMDTKASSKLAYNICDCTFNVLYYMDIDTPTTEQVKDVMIGCMATN